MPNIHNTKRSGVIEVEERRLNIEEKKEYLNQYQDCMAAVKRISEELRMIRLNEMCPSVFISDMPGSHNIKDMSDYATVFDELMTELLQERYKRILTYREIRRSIETLKNEEEKEVLIYRYIQGLKWNKIAKKMHVEWAQVHRIHNRALFNLEIYKKTKDDTQ